MIDVYTDPDVPTLPPHITFEQAKNYSTALLRMDPDEGGIIGEIRCVTRKEDLVAVWKGRFMVALKMPTSAPVLHPASHAVLQSGMVHNMEPAVYLDGKGGMRLNDNILVRPDGNEVLSKTLPRDLDWLVVE